MGKRQKNITGGREKVAERVRKAAEVFDEYGDAIEAAVRFLSSDKTEVDDIFQKLFLSLVNQPIPAGLWGVKEYLYRAVMRDLVDAARRREFYAAPVKIARAYSELAKRIDQIDYRTLTHSSSLEKLEADVHLLKKRERLLGRGEGLVAYVNDELDQLSESTSGLGDAAEDKARVLYYIMEVEGILGRLEEKARAASKKYEARLAACLRDVCWVNEPRDLSAVQIERFCACLRVLVNGWGKVNREKMNWVCGRLLDVDLTWLPVTEKVAKEIGEEAEADE